MIRLLVILALTLVPLANRLDAAITDFGTWSLVEDPAHPSFSASANSASVSLFAGATPIPDSFDIGYQSVNGETVASSTQGYFFSPLFDFALSVDYRLSFRSANGFLGLGFGIGEDRDGADGAGVAMLTQDGIPYFGYGGAARVDDDNWGTLFLGNPILDPSSLEGTLFVDYEAASGNVTLGASTSIGADAPDSGLINTFVGVQNEWDDENLLASFFIRSQEVSGTAWQGGDAEAVFSNFRVLDGTAISVPEPSCLSGLIAVFGCGLLRRRR